VIRVASAGRIGAEETTPMTRLVPFLGRKFAFATEKTATSPLPASAPGQDEIELDNELFFPLAAQLGQENEGIRNLLLEAEHKIGELENIKRMLGDLIDPVARTLRSYEEVKREKLNLQSALNTIRVTHTKLRENFADAEKRAATLDTECKRLRDMATLAQQSAAVLERTKAEQAAEIHTRRAQVAELQRHVQQQGSELQVTRDDNRRLGERCAAADKRTVQAEAENRAAQQKAVQATNERAAVQTALDKALNEYSQTARKLTETEKTLAATQAKLKSAEAALAQALSESTELSAALDEANQKHLDEASARHAHIEALQARANVNEKLLEEARRALMARCEEVRALERSAAESFDSHSGAVERLAQMTSVLAEREQRLKELEQSEALLSEQNRSLTSTLAAREEACNRAQQKVKEQEELMAQYEGQFASTREASELQIEQLTAQVQREKIERAMAEGALESGRKDIARLMHELAAMQVRSGATIPLLAPPEETASPGAPAGLKTAA
jgi:chromosome segregation ATPase